MNGATDALAAVRAVYADLAKRPLERSCIARTECCQFRLTGLTPQLTKGEALLAAKAFRATGRKALPAAKDGACPFLKHETGRCLIYADRPFGCRTHFCDAAGGPYPRKQVLDLIRRLEEVDRQLGGVGPRKIEAAVANALEQLQNAGMIHPQVRIGHVHLKVADLERALGFYRDVLGFEVTQRYGREAAFLSAGGYHHHLGLNTWESAGGAPPPPGSTGLYHVAILYPTRALLADAFQRLVKAGISLDGASDHGVSEALYLRDPDGNGVELYWDRPPERWPRTATGELAMFTRALDLDALLEEAPQ